MFFKEKPQPVTQPVAAAPVTFEQHWNNLTAQKGVMDANELGSRLSLALLEQAVRLGASDIHFDPHGIDIQVRFRLDGNLVDIVRYEREAFPVTARLRVMANFSPKAATAYSPEDGRFEIKLGDKRIQFRASGFPTTYGDKLVLRVLNTADVASLDQLGFSPEVRQELDRAIRSPNGIFLVAGYTGSGKSTTLTAILQALARPELNIMTLEDPVEYELPRVNHSQIHPRAGFTFAEGLKSMLRQDPNIIMVGEIRDIETAEIALRAATTGHLIFSTIHATTSVGVVTRLVGMGIEPYLITSAFIGSLAQRLVRKVCVDCAEPTAADFNALSPWLRALGGPDREKVEAILKNPKAKFLKPKGCPNCRQTGYRGRIGIFELLIANDALRTLISSKADVVALRQECARSNMKSLLVDALTKAAQGLTTLDEVAKAIAP